MKKKLSPLKWQDYLNDSLLFSGVYVAKGGIYIILKCIQEDASGLALLRIVLPVASDWVIVRDVQIWFYLNKIKRYIFGVVQEKQSFQQVFKIFER